MCTVYEYICTCLESVINHSYTHLCVVYLARMKIITEMCAGR